MRKEVLIAIIGGLIIGLTIAFGSWRINKVVQKNPQNFASNTNKLEENSANALNSEKLPNDQAGITYSNIENLQVITSSPYKVSGITKQNTIVAISGETKDIILPTNTDGSFQSDMDLTSGINQLVTAVYDLNGNSINQIEHILVYSNELAKYTQISQENTATESADSTLNKVKEKVESMRKNPRAIIGTVTDKTGNSLQLKNLDGKIELVSVATETSFAKGQKDASFDDVAIGDFLTVLGFANGTSVHEAKLVLLTGPISEPTRKIVSGEVVNANLNKKEITINDANRNPITMTFPKKWSGPEIKNLPVGTKTVAVYDISNSKPTVRTIEIIVAPSPTTVPAL